ncbi:hypothetical protein Ssi02_08750 [Sinosporangium siamense]|uniref:DUF308 domain-containing protein n=2 Tax=Sinosporangium siamense TaxID=1367973 RepID=A0A919RDX2_9ACTN|nr:hypothetical protein Ssi02_08750 [Sinosporangium siamense]
MHLFLWVLFPLIGVGLGGLLVFLIGWLADLPWVPFKGPIDLIDSIPDPWLAVGLPAAGLLIGLVVSMITLHESVSVTISDDRVALTTMGKERAFPREAVEAVFVDAKHLVVLGHHTEELAREKHEGLPISQLEAAFTGHGYRYLDGDPHKADFRRWVPDMPGLPPGADALLKARQKALEKSDQSDVRDLRHELGKIGVVVKEEGKRQFWRPSQRPGPQSLPASDLHP